jgi:hypothetical protein
VVVDVVNGVVVPVGGGLGAVVLLIGVVVPVGPGLGVLPLDVTGSVPPLVGPASVLPVVAGAAGDRLGATLLGLVVAGLEPSEPGPVPPEVAEPDGDEAGPLDEPELAVVGLVKLLVGLVKLLVGLGLAPAEPAELDAAGPAEPDGAEPSPLGDAALAVVGVRPAAVEPAVAPVTPPVPPTPEAPVPEAAVPEAAVPEAAVPEAAVPEAAVPEAAVPEAAVPEPVGLFAKLDVTGLVALDGAATPAPPLATVFGVATPIDIWITGTGPVENFPDPVAVTPLPSTLYISR